VSYQFETLPPFLPPLQPGETLAKALKRLSAAAVPQRPLTKRDRLKAAAAASGGDKDKTSGGSETAVDAAGSGQSTQAAFLRMTEIADRLVAEGEHDVFTETREDFERFGAMWGALAKTGQTLPKASAGAATAAARSGGSNGVAAGACCKVHGLKGPASSGTLACIPVGSFHTDATHAQVMQPRAMMTMTCLLTKTMTTANVAAKPRPQGLLLRFLAQHPQQQALQLVADPAQRALVCPVKVTQPGVQ
jgi:hypothetical protein